ncbi:hypothetical protein HDV00_003459 [Rhizophlyctis rosea]|nr:hypothetical protein HDV00_003459 [Rhizophlyctis rosea]
MLSDKLASANSSKSRPSHQVASSDMPNSQPPETFPPIGRTGQHEFGEPYANPDRPLDPHRDDPSVFRGGLLTPKHREPYSIRSSASAHRVDRYPIHGTGSKAVRSRGGQDNKWGTFGVADGRKAGGTLDEGSPGNADTASASQLPHFPLPRPSGNFAFGSGNELRGSLDARARELANISTAPSMYSFQSRPGNGTTTREGITGDAGAIYGRVGTLNSLPNPQRSSAPDFNAIFRTSGPGWAQTGPSRTNAAGEAGDPSDRSTTADVMATFDSGNQRVGASTRDDNAFFTSMGKSINAADPSASGPSSFANPFENFSNFSFAAPSRPSTDNNLFSFLSSNTTATTTSTSPFSFDSVPNPSNMGICTSESRDDGSIKAKTPSNAFTFDFPSTSSSGVSRSMSTLRSFGSTTDKPKSSFGPFAKMTSWGRKSPRSASLTSESPSVPSAETVVADPSTSSVHASDSVLEQVAFMILSVLLLCVRTNDDKEKIALAESGGIRSADLLEDSDFTSSGLIASAQQDAERIILSSGAPCMHSKPVDYWFKTLWMILGILAYNLDLSENTAGLLYAYCMAHELFARFDKYFANEPLHLHALHIREHINCIVRMRFPDLYNELSPLDGFPSLLQRADPNLAANLHLATGRQPDRFLKVCRSMIGLFGILPPAATSLLADIPTILQPIDPQVKSELIAALSYLRDHDFSLYEMRTNSPKWFRATQSSAVISRFEEAGGFDAYRAAVEAKSEFLNPEDVARYAKHLMNKIPQNIIPLSVLGIVESALGVTSASDGPSSYTSADTSTTFRCQSRATKCGSNAVVALSTVHAISDLLSINGERSEILKLVAEVAQRIMRGATKAEAEEGSTPAEAEVIAQFTATEVFELRKRFAALDESGLGSVPQSYIMHLLSESDLAFPPSELTADLAATHEAGSTITLHNILSSISRIRTSQGFAKPTPISADSLAAIVPIAEPVPTPALSTPEAMHEFAAKIKSPARMVALGYLLVGGKMFYQDLDSMECQRIVDETTEATNEAGATGDHPNGAQ